MKIIYMIDLFCTVKVVNLLLLWLDQKQKQVNFVLESDPFLNCREMKEIIFYNKQWTCFGKEEVYSSRIGQITMNKTYISFDQPLFFYVQQYFFRWEGTVERVKSEVMIRELAQKIQIIPSLQKRKQQKYFLRCLTSVSLCFRT